jgi:hypothetical protein
MTVRGARPERVAALEVEPSENHSVVVSAECGCNDDESVLAPLDTQDSVRIEHRDSTGRTLVYPRVVEVTSMGCPGCTRDAVVVPASYRVVLWEQPDVEGVHSESIGWGEAAFDLSGVDDVREVVRWAEDQLASGAGAYSGAGRAVRDRVYVIYASVEVLREKTLVQVAGIDPTRGRAAPHQVVFKQQS